MGAAQQVGFTPSSAAQNRRCAAGVRCLPIVAGAEQGNVGIAEIKFVCKLCNERHGLKGFERRAREHGRAHVASMCQQLAPFIDHGNRAVIYILRVLPPKRGNSRYVFWQLVHVACESACGLNS